MVLNSHYQWKNLCYFQLKYSYQKFATIKRAAHWTHHISLTEKTDVDKIVSYYRSLNKQKAFHLWNAFLMPRCNLLHRSAFDLFFFGITLLKRPKKMNNQIWFLNDYLKIFSKILAQNKIYRFRSESFIS